MLRYGRTDSRGRDWREYNIWCYILEKKQKQTLVLSQIGKIPKHKKTLRFSSVNHADDVTKGVRENPGSTTITNRSPSQTLRGRGNRQIQTSTNRTNVRKALRLALSLSLSSPKRGKRNAKRTEKHKNKMTQGKTYNKSPRRINHKATKSKTNTETTALGRSVE